MPLWCAGRACSAPVASRGNGFVLRDWHLAWWLCINDRLHVYGFRSAVDAPSTCVVVACEKRKNPLKQPDVKRLRATVPYISPEFTTRVLRLVPARKWALQ